MRAQGIAIHEVQKAAKTAVSACGSYRKAADALGNRAWHAQLWRLTHEDDFIPSQECATALEIWVGPDGHWLRIIPSGVYSMHDLPAGTVVLAEPFCCAGCMADGRRAWYVGRAGQRWCPEHGWATPQGRAWQRRRRVGAL
jgi:hypothetical protein